MGASSDDARKSQEKLYLDKFEKNLIESILNIEGFGFSARLLKRFNNIYLIARHMHISKRIKGTGAKEGNLPPDSFPKWLALSVLMPFETKALIEWWKANSWEDTYRDGKLFVNSKFVYLENIAERISKRNSPFEKLDIKSLDKLANLYGTLMIDHLVAADTLNITCCFNLILD